jgi:hypothetical protein
MSWLSEQDVVTALPDQTHRSIDGDAWAGRIVVLNGNAPPSPIAVRLEHLSAERVVLALSQRIELDSRMRVAFSMPGGPFEIRLEIAALTWVERGEYVARCRFVSEPPSIGELIRCWNEAQPHSDLAPAELERRIA